MQSFEQFLADAMMEGPEEASQRKEKLGVEGKFSHYRRSKTNKAPRKRTFIANMTKYNEVETNSLESAARGVGVAAGGGKLPGGASFSPDQSLHMGGGGTAYMRGTAGSFNSAFATPVSATLDTLPWDLASLPTLSNPVVWGAKEVPGQQAWGSAAAADTTYTELLMGGAVPPPQQQVGAASAVEAALAVLAANNVELPHAWQQQQQQQLASAGSAAQPMPMLMSGGPSWQASPNAMESAPAEDGTPKVSFDLFPELAALAVAGGAPAASGAVSTAAPARMMNGPVCYSRAVVTGMPSEMQVHDTNTAFAAATSSMERAASQPVAQQQLQLAAANRPAMQPQHSTGLVGLQLDAARSGTSAAATAMTMQHMSATAAAMAAGMSAPAIMAMAAAAKQQQQQQQHVMAAYSSAGSSAARNSITGSMMLAGSGPSAQHHSSNSSSSGLSSAMSAQAPLAVLLLQQQQQQHAVLAAAAQQQARLMAQATKSSGRNSSPADHQPAALLAASQQESPKLTTALSNGAGRGLKRGRGTVSSSGTLPAAIGSLPSDAAAATVLMDSNSQRSATAAQQHNSSVTGPVASAGSNDAAARPTPFTLPLHGVSAAGAVVPGGAGQLKVTSLVSVGAYGMVYRGRWAETEVAVKMMRTPRAGEPLSASDVLRSFRHESSLLKRLAHPNIVSLRHAQDVEPVCIVQDFASHGTLSEYVHARVDGMTAALRPASDFERLVLRRLARRLAMTPDSLIADVEARSVASAALLAGSSNSDNYLNHKLLRRYVVLLCLLRDVASAFVYLSALPADMRTGALTTQSVVHRDVKPTNILLSAQGTALLADFGVAKLLTQPLVSPLQPALSAPNPELTRPAMSLAPAASAPGPMDAVRANLAAGHADLAGDSVMDMFSNWQGDNGTDGLLSWGLPAEPLAKRVRSASTGQLPTMAAAHEHNKAAGMPAGANTFDLLPSIDIDMSWLNGLLDEEQDEGETMVPGAASAHQPASSSGMGHPSNSSLNSNTSAVQAPAVTPTAAAAAPAPAAVAPAAGSWPEHRGTAHYAAPEDLLDSAHPLTPAADMFSLGYVMWEALGGQRPWSGECSADVVSRAKQGARLPLPASWPRRMRALIAWCWASNPTQRPTAVQVLAELDAEIRTALARQ